MASATLRILAYRAADAQAGTKAGYRAVLTEDGKQPVEGLLTAESFGAGAWTVTLGDGRDVAPAAAVPNSKDIVDTVIGTPGAQRPQVDWKSMSATLFALLFPDGALRDAYKKFPSNTELLLDIEPSELARVPWELAQSEQPVRRLSINNALSRLHADRLAPLATIEWPLRVLILVGTSAAESKNIGVDEEVDLIRRALVHFGRSVVLLVRERPAKNELSDLIKGANGRPGWKPHVLHFIGHTALTPEGRVGLSIENAVPWVWSDEDIQSDLDLFNWIPRFVFLNACRTGDDPRGAWGMQRSFVEAGSEYVLTMLGDVSGRLAGDFAHDVYEQIVQEKPMRAAVLEARGKLQGRQQGTGMVDWALPSFSVSKTATPLFNPGKPPAEDGFADCTEFDQARIFASCDDARSVLTHWICCATNGQPNDGLRNVVQLIGEPHTGKSHLIKWAMESWSISRAIVRYVVLHDGSSRDFLSIVRQIRDGNDKGGYLQQPLPPAAFKRFNWTLGNLLTSGVSGDWKEEAHPEAQIDDDPALKLLEAHGEKRLEPAICEEFHLALKKVAEARPLVLVFNKFSPPNSQLVSPDDFARIVTHLFKPIAQDPKGRIKLVFCATKVQRDAYKLDDLDDWSVVYPVTYDYKKDELVRSAVEMLRFKYEDEVKAAAEGSIHLPYRNAGIEIRGLSRLARIKAVLPEEWVDEVKRMK